MPKTIINQQAHFGLTQAGGAQSFDIDEEGREHQITVETVGGPTAGTLQVQTRAPGATAYNDIGSTIDMVNGPLIFHFKGRYDSLQLTPSGFNGTSYGFSG